MTRKEVFTIAANKIEKDGLMKGSYGTDDGPVCAMGALRIACFGSIQYDKIFDKDDEYIDIDKELLFKEIITYLRDDRSIGIMSYSDSHSQQEVVAKLRELAND